MRRPVRFLSNGTSVLLRRCELPTGVSSARCSNAHRIEVLRRETMPETVRERINTYIEDAIAAERNFEDALHAFGKTGVQEPVRVLLASAGDKARTQHQRLT